MDEGECDDHEALLAAVARGDVDALERLYRELRVAVYGMALAVLRDRDGAEDVLHDTFVRVHDKAATYRPGSRPRAWVLAIARDLAIDAGRRRSREPALGTVEPASSDESLLWVDALMALASDERAIVALRILGGLSHADIAEQLGLPAGTVRWKYRVALRRLRRRRVAERAVDGLVRELATTAPDVWAEIRRSVRARAIAAARLAALDRPPSSHSRLGRELRLSLPDAIVGRAA
jgi:RNA polymerase sigma-70 factor (ECF subfamily)